MQNKSLSKIRLLYVEDDESIRTEITEIFKNECLELIVATNGEEGLELYHQRHPDIILTDVSMPKMDGLTMAQRIKQENPTIPIIISSAFNETKYFLKAISLGINNYLLKPINLRELFSVLENAATQFLMQRELQESERLLAQYKTIVDESSIVSKTNVKGIITYVNDAFVKISGYSREELIGKNHNLVRHPDMSSFVYKDLWQTILSKKKWHGVVQNRAKDGSSYYVDSTITPIMDLNGNIVEFISMRLDVTKNELQKRDLEKNLKTSAQSLEEKVSFIYEYEKALKVSTLFCRTTSDNVITMTSEAFDTLLGYEENELETHNYSIILLSDNKTQLLKRIAKSVNNAKPWQGILSHVSKSGEELYLETSFIPIVDSDKNILEVLCFYIDLTERVQLNQEIISTQREVISTMGAIGETRSKETGAHVRRVAEYSKLLALIAGLSIEDAEELKMASPMHDIGKVGIPDNILNKPAKLTQDEFEIMKTHASLGYEMLRHSNQKLLRSAAIVANEHHEKWDGSGYPNGLSKGDIHIYGRITAIADVFDALGHDRVYKKAWPLENILELLKKEQGKHFDPNLVDLFMNNLDEFLRVKKEFDEENL